MQLSEIDYKKLVPIAFVIFIGILALIFYFFAQAFSSSPNNPNRLGTYSNPQYKVSFNYPGTWNQIGGYDYDRYEGDTGFFGASGLGGIELTLDEATKNAYSHKLLPYGQHPVIEKLKVDGQPAKLIIPSEDQAAEMKGQAELIVLYPTPIVIAGNTYKFFVLWADKNNIRTIIPTITFRE
jgi:TolB protein